METTKPPSLGNEFEVDEAVRANKLVDASFGMHYIQLLTAIVSSGCSAFPLPNTTHVTAYSNGVSLWGKIAKLVTKLEDGQNEYYFLKVVGMG